MNTQYMNKRNNTLIKCSYYFLGVIISLILFESCQGQDIEKEIEIDPLTYATNFSFREVSIKIGEADWVPIEDGNLFSMLGNSSSLEDHLKLPTGVATYNDKSNLNADFIYTIANDFVFSYKLAGDKIYFLDENKENRTDLIGEILLNDEKIIIFQNKSISPNILIKCKFEE